MSVRRVAAGAFAGAILAVAVVPAGASALDPFKPVCTAAGLFSGLVGKACSVASNGKRLLGAGKQLVTGHVGGAIKTALSDGASAAGSTATTTLGLTAIAVWAMGGAHFALNETAQLIGATTRPRLGAAWFSRVYWRVAGIAVLLTLPFLFAAAVQALVRADLALLVRAAFGYLPLAMVGVAIATQVTALLLSATDALCSLVSAAAGGAGSGFLSRAGGVIGALSLGSRSPFLVFLVAVFTVAATIVLWIELTMREAAVYVIVAMLPLAFAALVWPARRVWAQRGIEVLVALILSKLAIVAVLTLGGAALAQTPSPVAFTTGLVLVLLGAFAPWAVMRLVPVAELSASAAGRLRGELTPSRLTDTLAWGFAERGHGWASAMTSRMRDDAGHVDARGAAEDHLERFGDGGTPPEEPTAAAGDGGPPEPAPSDGGGPTEPRAPSGRGPDPIRSDLDGPPNVNWKPLILGREGVASWSADAPWPPEPELEAPHRGETAPEIAPETAPEPQPPERQDPEEGRL